MVLLRPIGAVIPRRRGGLTHRARNGLSKELRSFGSPIGEIGGTQRLFSYYSKTTAASNSRSAWFVLDDESYMKDCMVSNVDLVAVGKTVFPTEKDGEWYWGSGIPSGLHNKLWGRQRSLPSVDFAVFGPTAESYFVQFRDGHAQWGVGRSPR